MRLANIKGDYYYCTREGVHSERRMPSANRCYRSAKFRMRIGTSRRGVFQCGDVRFPCAWPLFGSRLGGFKFRQRGARRTRPHYTVQGLQRFYKYRKYRTFLAWKGFACCNFLVTRILRPWWKWPVKCSNQTKVGRRTLIFRSHDLKKLSQADIRTYAKLHCPTAYRMQNCSIRPTVRRVICALPKMCATLFSLVRIPLAAQDLIQSIYL